MKIIRKIHDLQSLNILRGSNLKIALLGGSFNPAHQGHLQISKVALNTLGFDYVIWLVALQNPLKGGYKKDIFGRAEQALKIANHPRIIVSSLENDLSLSYSYDVIKFLIKRFSNIDFTWLMGADNMQNFHRWKKSDQIINLCKIIVFDRPGYLRYFASFNQKYKPIIAKKQTEGIMFFRGVMSKISSSEIRQSRNDKNY